MGSFVFEPPNSWHKYYTVNNYLLTWHKLNYSEQTLWFEQSQGP